MPPESRPQRAPKGITFTVRPAPGLTKEERLARRLRAVEALLSRYIELDGEAVVVDDPSPGDGAGDSPPRRPA